MRRFFLPLNVALFAVTISFAISFAILASADAPPPASQGFRALPVPRLTLGPTAPPDGGMPDGGASISKIPADPSPLAEKVQFVLDLKYIDGDVFLLETLREEHPSPVETPRVMGRFALELYEGKTLVERTRFDFPGLLYGHTALEEADAGARRLGANFHTELDRHLITRIGVRFPATSRGTRLELWDRATNQRWRLPWPLAVGVASPDAGAVR